MSKLSGKNLLETIKNKGKSLEAEMSFFDHLEVLRWHLIRTAIAVVVLMILIFLNFGFIYDTIIMGPRHVDFWTYRMLCKIGTALNMEGFCVSEIPGKMINTKMAGQFMMQLNSSLIIAIMLGFPYMLYEIWLFIKPALTSQERKSANGFVFFATILFIMGILFGYYLVTPLSVNFLANYSISDDIDNTITIESYLSFVSTLSLGCGIVFELPIVIYILSKLGVMTPEFMRSTRRYAVVIILLISAIITPTPDILTMLTVSAPMFILYELSILISARVQKNRIKRDKLFYSETADTN